ncbi:alpha/beta-hydrolase [Lenzites betulinus]|nr:alpha/beta-hydrolase [Lenzites betulinus]
MDANLYKDATVSRGLTYHYFYSPAKAGQPTLLLLHGFPSSSFEWHRQVEYFKPKGYGLLVPDMLGAGKTSKPVDIQVHLLNLMAQDVVDLLDAEGLDKVVGIGHDWGSAVLSRLANLYSERFSGFAWLALSYFPPRWQQSAIGQSVAKTETGTLGYWTFFCSEDAPLLSAKNIDSFMQLTFPTNPDFWRDYLLPQGKTREWMEEDRKPGLPSWLSQEDYDTKREILLNGGIRSAANYYKAMMSGVNDQDNAKIPEEAEAIKKPALFFATTRDAVCTSTEGKAVMAQYAPHATIIELNTGHWPNLEQAETVNSDLERWVGTLGL